MSTDETIRLLVLSDLHAYEGKDPDSGPSALSMAGSAQGAKKIFQSVATALSEVGVTTVDAVLCGGDMTDRAESGALALVWQQLADLAVSLNAPLIATAGNHDYSSHGDASKPIDPKEGLIELTPFFPSGHQDRQRDYFTYNFAVEDLARLRVVTLNSSALHGLAHEGNPEYNHGRVSASTVKRLTQRLATAANTETKVLLTHHHPIQLPYFDTAERSQIVDAGLLLQALEDDGPWLIIHGHKHRPWLQYSQGGGGSPVVFSAGSFTANLGGGDFGTSIRNQFYLIELEPLSVCQPLGLDIAGTIKAWSRAPYGPQTWVKAGPTDGMPASSGFGWRVSPTHLARRLIDWLGTNNDTITQDDLNAWEPRLRFVTAHDLDRTFEVVEQGGAFSVERNNYGEYTGFTVIGGNKS